MCLGKEKIEEASNILRKLLEGVDIEEEESENIEAGDVRISPGHSSASPVVEVRINGEWINQNNTRISTAPLAEVGSHKLCTDRIWKAAKSEDETLAKMIEVFMIGSISGSEIWKPTVSRKSPSKGFLASDVEMLLKAGIVRRRQSKFSLQCFKVQKKDPSESRFITDCRAVNEAVTLFKGVEMNIPALHEVTKWGLEYEIVWSIDAKAYFFQFELKGPSEGMFPMVLKTEKSNDEVCLTRLPMGSNVAPIIAQRTSNLVVNATTQEMRKKRLNGEVVAWVDNFIIFAHSVEEAEAIMNLLENKLRFFNIKCSEVDKSFEFLGMEKNKEGIRLNKSFREKLWSELNKVESNQTASKAERESLGGKLMWLNYSVLRAPLALFPHTLNMLRENPNLLKGSKTYINEELKEELRNWKKSVDHLLKKEATKELREVWSDATTTTIAIVCEETVLMARFDKPISIAVAEALAAAWGTIVFGRAVSLFIDNQAVAYAFAKGHCKSQAINTILRNTFQLPVTGRITWVPTCDQVADGPTRGKLPSWDFQSRERWTVLKSWLFKEY